MIVEVPCRAPASSFTRLLFCTSTCTSGRVRSSRIGSWGISAPQNLPASFELATLAEMQVVQQNKGQQTSWVSSTSATDATGFRWCRYARSNTRRIRRSGSWRPRSIASLQRGPALQPPAARAYPRADLSRAGAGIAARNVTPEQATRLISRRRVCASGDCRGEQANARQMNRNLTIALFLGIIVGLAGMIVVERQTRARLRTVTAFVESYFFQEALAACEAMSFPWEKAKTAQVVGLRSFKSKGMIIPMFTLYADGIYCDYSPATKKASIRSES